MSNMNTGLPERSQSGRFFQRLGAGLLSLLMAGQVLANTYPACPKIDTRVPNPPPSWYNDPELLYTYGYNMANIPVNGRKQCYMPDLSTELNGSGYRIYSVNYKNDMKDRCFVEAIAPGVTWAEDGDTNTNGIGACAGISNLGALLLNVATNESDPTPFKRRIFFVQGSYWDPVQNKSLLGEDNLQAATCRLATLAYVQFAVERGVKVLLPENLIRMWKTYDEEHAVEQAIAVQFNRDLHASGAIIVGANSGQIGSWDGPDADLDVIFDVLHVSTSIGMAAATMALWDQANPCTYTGFGCSVAFTTAAKVATRPTHEGRIGVDIQAMLKLTGGRCEKGSETCARVSRGSHFGNGVADTMIDSSPSTANTYFGTQTWAKTSSLVESGMLLRFLPPDARLFPPGAQITSAVMALTRSLDEETWQGSVNVENALVNWYEPSITWNQFNRRFTTNSNNPVQGSITHVKADVTRYFQEWLAGQRSNHGFYLRALNDGPYGITDYRFSTSEVSSWRERPELHICWKTPEGTPAATLPALRIRCDNPLPTDSTRGTSGEWEGLSGRMTWTAQGRAWEATQCHFELSGQMVKPASYVTVCSRGYKPSADWWAELPVSHPRFTPVMGERKSYDVDGWYCLRDLVPGNFNPATTNVKVGYVYGFEGRNHMYHGVSCPGYGCPARNYHFEMCIPELNSMPTNACPWQQ